MKNFKVSVTDIIMFVLSLLLCFGAAFLFPACDHLKDDGSFMNCHWAGQMLIYMGGLLSVMSIGVIFIPDRKVKAGLSLGAVLAAVLSALVPGTIIGLCGMAEMQCRALMQPVSILVSSAVAVAALANAVYHIKKSGKEN